MYFATFLNNILVNIVFSAKSNPVIAIVVLILLAIFIYRRPLVSLFILLFCLLLFVVIYLLIGISNPWLFNWNLP